jgi:hypothetical protein
VSTRIVRGAEAGEFPAVAVYVCVPSLAPVICTLQSPDTDAVVEPRTVDASNTVTVLPADAVPDSVNAELVLQLFSAGDVIAGAGVEGASTVNARAAGVGSVSPVGPAARTKKV